jgi:hypothetical protein
MKLLPNLWLFCLTVHPADSMCLILLGASNRGFPVPEDLVEDAIWSLSLRVQCSEQFSNANPIGSGKSKAKNDYIVFESLGVRFLC